MENRTARGRSGGFLWLASPALLGACAGPNTPLGRLSPVAEKTRDIASGLRESPPAVRLEFSPPRQRLHARTAFSIKITDERGIPAKPRLRVFYASYDITEGFLDLAKAERSDDRRSLRLRFPALALTADREHDIEFEYRASPADAPRFATFGPPECDPGDLKAIRNTGIWDPPPEWLRAIDALAVEHRFSPAMVAGLIAQESGFDPGAISWAKAVGLTQITNIADTELLAKHAEWPRSAQIDALTVPHLKYLVHSGGLGHRDDWRLSPTRSIEGALTYLEVLRDDWRGRMKTLRAQFGAERPFVYDADLELQVLLASYNSGSTRVLRSLKKWGPAFLNQAGELDAAQVYVRKIRSYCDAFGGDLQL